ncbi:MAG: RloB family protein, partial [Bacilli bacterium]|nr:RloB family protein [Bacilli bacterium]
MPPICKTNLKRNIGSKANARKIYYLLEGNVTEPRFFDELFEKTNFVDSKEIRIIKCEKTKNDRGASNCLSMIELAKNYLKNKKDFKKGYDKILIVFDLDIYKKDLSRLINCVREEKDVIFGFSNPSFELFLLMCLDKNFIKNLDSKTKENIIANEYIEKDRFIYYLIKNDYKFDSKNKKSDFLMIAKNIENAFDQK